MEREPRHTVAAVSRDQVLDLCSRLPGAAEDTPFGDDVAAFKVGERMFAVVPARRLRQCQPQVRPWVGR
jgi:predicted DNA-binding protein (MmcQ/YjbR family)